MILARSLSALGSLLARFPVGAALGSGDALPAAPTTIAAVQRAYNAARTGLETMQSGVTGAVATVLGWKNVLPGAQYVAAGVTVADGYVTTLLATVNGFLKVSMGDLVAGENSTIGGVNGRMETLEAGTATNVTTNATTVAKTGAGALLGVLVGIGGTTSQVVLYDNTAGSGTILATLATTVAGFYRIPVKCSLGVTAVTTGGAAANLTIVTE